MSKPIVDTTFTVGATALTRFRVVKTPAALVVGAAATDTVVGIVQDGAAIGGEAVVRQFGQSTAIASAAIAKGVQVGLASAGRVVTWSGTLTDTLLGVSKTAAAADGDHLEIIITGHSPT